RKHFQFQQGPIFAHILLADEVNRATPKTQSALLEGMQEGAVTVSGTSNPLPSPFFVLATQNPIEMEGTYPLPEAQLDRFLFKLRVRYPALEELAEIIERTTHVREVEVRRVMTGPQVMGFRELVREVPIASHVRDLASLIVLSTHPQWERAPDAARRFVRYGGSPRGAQALVLGAKVRALAEGRYNVSVEDLRAGALPDPTVLQRLVSDVVRQIRRRRAEYYGLRGLFIGALAALLPLLLRELLGTLGLGLAGGLLVGGALAGGLYGFCLKLPAGDAARLADRGYGLQDRVATA